MHPLTLRLPVKMLPQPDETTCGPTCLHAIHRYWGEDARLAEVIARRILRAVGPECTKSRLQEVYRELCDCLEAGRMFVD